ncbi:MAG: hypothetical protein EA341_01630 [Mongoliibacter sp.]|uniref:hypothetical protein n=1 Tax=Mongoliibacter sp. TaxID=2022438 RepID=UPI0012EFBE34|nr:hypothetical protein [Mongoliibacter sp.]TVP53076.1 MAG: hypothetical protein EA341_01630 [Mongoliibacter sp.]
MKNLLSIALVLGIVSLSIAKNEEPRVAPVSVKLTEDGKALFRYKSAPQSPITVKIYDAEQRVIKSQKLEKSNSFAKYYDFSTLGPGKYTVEVLEKGMAAKKIPVMYEGERNIKPVAFSDLKRMEGNKVKMIFNSLLPTDITVYAFEDGKLIHQEKITSVSGVERMYKLKGVSPRAEIELAIQTSDGYSNRFKVN